MMIHEVDKDNYEHEIIQSERPVVAYFYANWCKFCGKMEPKFENLVKTFKGNVKFAKVDIDKEEEVASQNNLTAIPTIILYNGGREVGRIVGIEDDSVLLEKISTHLKDFY